MNPEQTRWLERRITDGQDVEARRWTPKSYSRWYDYSRARDRHVRGHRYLMGPWWSSINEDKRRGRLNVISHLLSRIP